MSPHEDWLNPPPPFPAALPCFPIIRYVGGPRAGEAVSQFTRITLSLPVLDGHYEKDFSLSNAREVVFSWVPTPEPDPSEFFAEPIIGYRAWHYNETLGLLTAAHGSTMWHPYRRMTAECNRTRHDSPAPHYYCTCGIYMHSSDERVKAQELPTAVTGEVYGWGKVVVADHGYRVQYAYPKSLRVSATLHNAELVARKLSKTYGVPAEVSADQPVSVTMVATLGAVYTITTSVATTNAYLTGLIVDDILRGRTFTCNPTTLGNTTISWTT